MTILSLERRNGKRTHGRRPRYRGAMLAAEAPTYRDPESMAPLSGPDWLAAQASYHRFSGRCSRPGANYDGVIAADLEAIRATWLELGATCPADLTGTVASPYHGLDLDAVAVPDLYPDNGVAQQFFHAAGHYLNCASEIGALVAHVLARRGLVAGSCEAETLGDYLDAAAALEAAWSDVFAGGMPGF
jgi:hypothetical protein